MKRQIGYAVLVIAVTMLSIAAITPVTLEYKMKVGDQHTYRVIMEVKNSSAGVSDGLSFRAEILLTQLVSDISYQVEKPESVTKETVFDLLGAANLEVTQATMGGKDVKDEMGEQASAFDLFQQKVLKDGGIDEFTDIEGISWFDFQKLFGNPGVLPGKPVNAGATWTWTAQKKLGNLSMTYALMGFELQKGHECAKIKGTGTGTLSIGESEKATVEKVENIIYFAVKEGLVVRQDMSLIIQYSEPAGRRATDVNFKLELQSQKHLTPEELGEMTKSYELVEAGASSLRNREYGKAEAKFQEFLSTYKENPWRPDVEKLLAKTKAPSYERLRWLREQGNLEELLASAREAMKSGTPNEKRMAADQLLNAYFDSNKIPELVSAFEKAVQENPTDLESYKMLGQIYGRQGNEANAIEMYEKAAILDPNDYQVHSSLGSLYRSKDMYEKAAVSYRRSLELHPGGYYIYPRIAEVYVKMGKMDEASKVADEFKQLMQESAGKRKSASSEAGMQGTLADIYSELSRYDEAVELYKMAIKLEPRMELYFKQRLALVYDKMGKPELAADLRESIKPLLH